LGPIDDGKDVWHTFELPRITSEWFDEIEQRGPFIAKKPPRRLRDGEGIFDID